MSLFLWNVLANPEPAAKNTRDRPAAPSVAHKDRSLVTRIRSSQHEKEAGELR